MNRLLRTAILGSLALSITACGGNKRVDPGPELTTAVVFKSERARYRMTVTCFGDRPSAVVLPL